MVHTRFSSVSRSPLECAYASKGKSKMSPKGVAMKNSKLKGKGKKANFTIQDNMIPPPTYCDANSGCISRMLSWSNDGNAKFEDVYTTLSLSAKELELRNLTTTASEIKELKLEELFPTSNQRSVQENDNSDDDFDNPPTPLLRLSYSHANAHEDSMSLVEMQRKLCTFETRQNNLTIEVNSLKTTITEMCSYFESIFSNLQETIMKEVRRKNENDDDVLFDNYTGDDLSNPIHESFCRASFPKKDAPITKDFDQDTRGWDPWPQNVVAREVVANEDASVKVATVDTEVAAVDGEVAGDPVKTAEKDKNVAIGDSIDAGVDGADDDFFGNLSDKELADLELVVQSSSKIGNPILGTSTEPIQPIPANPKRMVKLPSYLQSPFLQHFGSTSGKSTDSLGIQEVFKTVKGLSALDGKIGELPDFNITGEFMEWLDHGIITKKNATTFYSKQDNKINPTLNLGVDLVSQKTWFHIWEYGSKSLTNSHVDVFFYHLRKKVKENFELLSTDSNFQNRVSTMYNACVKKNNFTVNIKQEIVGVMMGDDIRYNTHWALGADVQFPVFIREQKY
ncbi:hypothetical protein AG4045_016312 [Apium graveolens]|uniref:Ubiquitin-like protease family profile domain-containing protein n=1 Tax=Apium graveolens TaxID=4045 RepID=A0A6L5B7I5_APIGR|nr:hypothetical protein AG4045_016312 [Apium graveolens]